MCNRKCDSVFSACFLFVIQSYHMAGKEWKIQSMELITLSKCEIMMSYNPDKISYKVL